MIVPGSWTPHSFSARLPRADVYPVCSGIKLGRRGHGKSKWYDYLHKDEKPKWPYLPTTATE